MNEEERKRRTREREKMKRKKEKECVGGREENNKREEWR